MGRPKIPTLTTLSPAVPGVIQLSHGLEFRHCPTPLARQLWYYVRWIGRSKHNASFQYDHPERDGFLLHFLLRGKLAHRLRERTFIAARGEACFMDLGVPVSYHAVGPDGIELCWVLFNGKDVSRVYLELCADRSPIFTSLDAPRMRKLFGELMTLTAQPPPAYEAEASALLSAILAELFKERPPRAGRGIGTEPRARLSEPVRKGMKFIDQFYHLSLPVKYIAVAAGVNPNYFTRRFHREVGLTPMAYVNQYRVDQAKWLLEASDKTIAEIARSVGFPDQGYFARVFTQLAGEAPREYRQKVRRQRADQNA
jgi:AraC-like DNA-binding protein